MFGTHTILVPYSFSRTRKCLYTRFLMPAAFVLPALQVCDYLSQGFLGEHAEEDIKKSEIGDYSPGTPIIGDDMCNLRRVGQYQ